MLSKRHWAGGWQGGWECLEFPTFISTPARIWGKKNALEAALSFGIGSAEQRDVDAVELVRYFPAGVSRVQWPLNEGCLGVFLYGIVQCVIIELDPKNVVAAYSQHVNN